MDIIMQLVVEWEYGLGAPNFQLSAPPPAVPTAPPWGTLDILVPFLCQSYSSDHKQQNTIQTSLRIHLAMNSVFSQYSDLLTHIS